MPSPRPSALLLACALLAAAGCQRGADAARIAAPAPAAAPAPPRLPDDFPQDVYLPADYDVLSLRRTGDARLLGLRARGRLPALHADARSQMRGLAWQPLPPRPGEDAATLRFEKGAREAELRFRPLAGGRVAVQLRLRERAPAIAARGGPERVAARAGR